MAEDGIFQSSSWQTWLYIRICGATLKTPDAQPCPRQNLQEQGPGINIFSNSAGNSKVQLRLTAGAPHCRKSTAGRAKWPPSPSARSLADLLFSFTLSYFSFRSHLISHGNSLHCCYSLHLNNP